ncbi:MULTISPECIES: ead/Ea22-like family protein [Klebsiella pneumoniae complex]|uniref:ead/Ea22-like family protein n=1 Tax=Klebsiella pneumoniae complex TaxID=3390273 RepID=UPI001F1D844A|nr:ead/Ea22-like family protein [Klebsiella pneumoniae]
MTDITELAQSLKAAAEKATPGEWRRASTQFNGITATPFMLGRKEVMIAGVSEKRDAEFIALANPANILALVEALEKAQETIAFQQGEIKALLSSLESRTVTVKLPLPRRKTADDYVDDTFEPCDLAAVYNACRLECEVKFKNALTAAGIKVEAE